MPVKQVTTGLANLALDKYSTIANSPSPVVQPPERPTAGRGEQPALFVFFSGLQQLTET